MNKELEAKIKVIFDARPEVKLAYLFGSRVHGNINSLSDYDFAVYFGGDISPSEAFDLKLSLSSELARVLKNDAIDIVVLDHLDAPELGYKIVSEGELLVDKEPHKVNIEPRLMNAYFDFKAVRKNALL